MQLPGTDCASSWAPGEGETDARVELGEGRGCKVREDRTPFMISEGDLILILNFFPLGMKAGGKVDLIGTTESTHRCQLVRSPESGAKSHEMIIFLNWIRESRVVNALCLPWTP